MSIRLAPLVPKLPPVYRLAAIVATPATLVATESPNEHAAAIGVVPAVTEMALPVDMENKDVPAVVEKILKMYSPVLLERAAVPSPRELNDGELVVATACGRLT